MSLGAWPLASAQLCKYHRSHSRGLICHSLSVAKMENSAAAKRPVAAKKPAATAAKPKAAAPV